MKNNLILYLIGALIIVSLWSCEQKEIYYEFATIPQNQWDKGGEVCFEIDSLLVNPLHKYNVYVEITHNVNYASKSLWLYINQTLQDTIVRRDTLECKLVNELGQWKGRGNGPTRQVSVLYKSGLNLDSIIQAKACISHAMQDLQLNGIEKIGLKIY